MRISYSNHFLIRLKERRIPKSFPGKILKNPDSLYLDTLRKRNIAVKQVKHVGKMKTMVVAYDIIDNEIQVVTIYPISKQEIRNKLTSRRWKEYEKD